MTDDRLDRGADELAERMANGASLVEAAYAIGVTLETAHTLWAHICEQLGPQAC